MESLPKILIGTGIFLIILGIFFTLTGKIPLVGKSWLPGDIYIKKENFSFYFPVTTSILISLVLTLLFQLFGRK